MYVQIEYKDNDYQNSADETKVHGDYYIATGVAELNSFARKLDTRCCTGLHNTVINCFELIKA